jgi:hypothetical protein
MALSLQAKFYLLIAVGVVVFVALVGLGTWLSYPSQTGPAKQSARTEKNAEHPYNVPPNVIGTLVMAAPREAASADAERSDSPQKAEQKSFGFWDATVTDLALVLFTYCLVIVGWATMKSNEQTLRILESSQVSILLSEEDDALKAGFRRADLNPDVGQRLPVSWQLFNSGRTVAFIDLVRAAYRLAPVIPEAPPYADAADVEFLDPTIAVNDSTKVKETTMKEEIWRKDANLMKGGETFVFFYGIIKYRDVFKGNRETAWCFRSERDGTFWKWGDQKYNYQK